MNDAKKKITIKKMNTQELELPDTHYVSDIDNKVFQGIVLESLSKIHGIAMVEGSFIDNIFGWNSLEGVKGISIEQDSKNHCVGVRIDVNIHYGFSIPEKAEEIQAICSEEITKLTGIHVSYVHVVFKSIILPEEEKQADNFLRSHMAESEGRSITNIADEYNDEF